MLAATTLLKQEASKLNLEHQLTIWVPPSVETLMDWGGGTVDCQIQGWFNIKGSYEKVPTYLGKACTLNPTTLLLVRLGALPATWLYSCAKWVYKQDMQWWLDSVVQGQSLPTIISASETELTVLTKALLLAKDKKVNIYYHSEYKKESSSWM